MLSAGCWKVAQCLLRNHPWQSSLDGLNIAIIASLLHLYCHTSELAVTDAPWCKQATALPTTNWQSLQSIAIVTNSGQGCRQFSPGLSASKKVSHLHQQIKRPDMICTSLAHWASQNTGIYDASNSQQSDLNAAFQSLFSWPSSSELTSKQTWLNLCQLCPQYNIYHTKYISNPITMPDHFFPMQAVHPAVMPACYWINTLQFHVYVGWWSTCMDTAIYTLSCVKYRPRCTIH